MQVAMSAAERAALVAEAATSRTVRRWRRFQALRLLADGATPAAVSRALGVTAASVYAWHARWRAAGLAGLREAVHRGPAFRLDAAAEALLTTWLGEDPAHHGYHSGGWTVALLQTALAAHGYALSDHTIRRALHRLGWRWKRPKYVLGRPDPAYAEKKGRS
jgi:transposase